MVQDILFDLVKNGKGCSFTSVDYTSRVDIPQKYGFGKEVTKHVVMSKALLNHDYAKVVNAHLTAKGLAATFVESPLKWGVWEEFRKVIAHKGKRYLRLYVGKQTKSEATYYISGRLATAAETAAIKAWEKTKHQPSKKQEELGLDEEDQVTPMVLCFDNIHSIRTFGQTWMSDAEEQRYAAAV